MSSLAGFFFGNVDRSGKIEDIPEEFQEALESLENSEQLASLFSARTLGVDEQEVQGTKGKAGAAEDEDEDEDEDDEGEVNFGKIRSTFEHDKDAVDYSDIMDNDLAADASTPETVMFQQRYLQKGLSTLNNNAGATTTFQASASSSGGMMATTATQSSLGPRSAAMSRMNDKLDEDYDAEDTDEEDMSKTRQPIQMPSKSVIQQPSIPALPTPSMPALPGQPAFPSGIALPGTPSSQPSAFLQQQQAQQQQTQVKQQIALPMPAVPSIQLPPQRPTVTSGQDLLIQQQAYLLEEQQQQGKAVAAAGAEPGAASSSEASAPLDVKAIYPAFEENKVLKFTELFNVKRAKRHYTSKSKPATFPKADMYRKEVDQRVTFDKPEEVTFSSQSYYDEYDEEILDKKLLSQLEWRVPDTKDLYAVQLDNWEDRIVWDEEDAQQRSREDGAVPGVAEPVKTVAKVVNGKEPKNATKFVIRNYELENGDWEDNILWDERTVLIKPFTAVQINLNDTNVLFDLTSTDTSKTLGHDYKVRRGRRSQLTYRVLTEKMMPSEAEVNKKLEIDRFNISGDRFYEAHKEGRFHRVRQTFGQLVVQHALPAVKLLKPWYKNRLSKSELRSFHRPQIQLPLNTDIHFLRVKGSKKKKQKRKELGEVMRSSKDLTLRDHTNFVLLEYSEEHPPIIQNVGMGSVLLNYYRKENIDDEHIPQKEIGDPFILDVADASPFLNFGNVEPGQTITALYNNLVRAPIFEQTPRHTDFVVIRNTYKGETKYYIRDIPHLFVVGQTYPVQEVPGPHSRKVTTMIKNRLQITAFRYVRKDPFHRLKFAKLCKAYPEYNDTQIRQRLKEFAEFQRKGINSGYWRLKANTPLPNEEEIRKMVTPEMVCLYEAMMVGQRHLLDAGYGRVADNDDGDEENEDNMDIEEQLAPWITTRNFLNATQGKAMLKLWGPGDPTGRGEGFSFIRVSMKDIFLRQGESKEEKLAQIEALPKSAHRYNVAEQQQVYREEILRIWNAQFQALSNQEEIEAGDDDVVDGAGDGSEEEDEDSYYRQRRASSTTPHPTVRASPAPSLLGFSREHREHSYLDDDNVSVAGSVSSRTSYGNYGNKNRVLTIRRAYRLPNGEKVWKTETIRDPAVINTYVRRRQLIEEQAINTEDLEPVDDEERNQLRIRRIQDEIAKLRRNQERRLARAASKGLIPMPEGGSGLGSMGGGLGGGSGSSGVSGAGLGAGAGMGGAGSRKKDPRRCGNCGQRGHMKTNKKCPMFVDPTVPINLPGTPGAAGMMSPPHMVARQGSVPASTPVPQTPGAMGGLGGSSMGGASVGISSMSAATPGVGSVGPYSSTGAGYGVGGDYFRQGSPASSGGGSVSGTSNKISIPKAVIDRVAEQEQDRESLSIRLPSKMLQQAPKRKRSETHNEWEKDDYYYLHPPIKSYGRRKKPEVELANIIENVLSTIMALQEATEFLQPVSAKIAPDYDSLIKHPRDLSGMRDANKNYYVYRTADAFLTDMRIMVWNSWIYNGEGSIWTNAARMLLSKAEEMLAPQQATIQQLEQEIWEADRKANLVIAANLAGAGAGGAGSGASTGTAANGGAPGAADGGSAVQLFTHPGGYGSLNSTTAAGAGLHIPPSLVGVHFPLPSSLPPQQQQQQPPPPQQQEVQVKAEMMEWE
ncbi:hypothetical protein BGZ73_002099 [Actinomortierella ambigua]|nr:hypothetical protein BGZ73_002099 [Actinomortierella ambigua]